MSISLYLNSIDIVCNFSNIYSLRTYVQQVEQRKKHSMALLQSGISRHCDSAKLIIFQLCAAVTSRTTSDGLQPKGKGLQPNSNGLQPNSDGLQPSSNGRTTSKKQKQTLDFLLPRHLFPVQLCCPQHLACLRGHWEPYGGLWSLCHETCFQF